MNSQNFNDVYMNLSRKDKFHIKVRNEIVTKCRISTSIFYNWMKGITPVPHWALPVISDILNKPVNELFPEYDSDHINY